MNDNRAYFDFIALGLQLFDGLNSAVSVTQSGVDEDVALAFDGSLAQFLGPCTGAGVGLVGEIVNMQLKVLEHFANKSPWSA